MKKIQGILFAMLALGMVACGGPSTRYVHPEKDANAVSQSIDEADFQQAAGTLIASMLNSGVLNRQGGGRYVLAISTVKNNTMQRIDKDVLIKRMRIDLLNSGKVVVTTAVTAGGAEDPLSRETRELRYDDEFNQNTIAAKGQLVAPDLSLSGKIIQRNTRIEKDQQRIDYYFQLSLTDIRSGLAFWEDEVIIGKMTSDKSSAW